MFGRLLAYLAFEIISNKKITVNGYILTRYSILAD
jgi:hypothetical protein